MTVQSPAHLTNQVKKLITKLKKYIRSQRELWQQVPHLALEADGRSGHNDIYATAWQRGYWPIQIHGAVSHGYVALIDLSSGKLVNAFDTNKKPIDRDLLIILSDVNVVNAKIIVSNLKHAAKQPYFHGYSPAEKKSWREKMRKDYNVKEIYNRS